MKLQDIVAGLGLEVLCGSERLGREVAAGYASDLLSDVLANGRAGDVWITLQVHANVVAVAAMKELAALIIVNARPVPGETIERAQLEGVTILRSALPCFELIGRLHAMGIAGDR